MATHQIKILNPNIGSRTFESNTDRIDLTVSVGDTIQISLDAGFFASNSASLWLIPNNQGAKSQAQAGHVVVSSPALVLVGDFYMRVDIGEKGATLIVQDLPGDENGLKYGLEVTKLGERPKGAGGGDGAAGSLTVSR